MGQTEAFRHPKTGPDVLKCTEKQAEPFGMVWVDHRMPQTGHATPAPGLLS
ncbi:response regulator [Acetobacter orientalis]|nr:response regulator [Acetobacter orientalis]